LATEASGPVASAPLVSIARQGLCPTLAASRARPAHFLLLPHYVSLILLYLSLIFSFFLPPATQNSVVEAVAIARVGM